MARKRKAGVVLKDHKGKLPPTIDDAHAPTILVDGYHGISIQDGVVRFNFFRVQMNPQNPDEIERHVVLRLAMGLPAIFKIHESLTELTRQLESQGIVIRTESGTNESKKK